MVKPEWGIKRLCQSCGARYYDFLRTPIVCPSCGTTFDSEAVLKSRRARPLPADDVKPKARKEKEAAVDPEEVDEEEEDELDDEDTIDDDDDLDDEDDAVDPAKVIAEVEDDDEDEVVVEIDDEDDVAPIDDDADDVDEPVR